MTSGVLYMLISNPQSAPRLCVSIWSLRKYYDGPIAIVANEATEDVVRKIADAFDAQVVMIDVPRYKRNGHFLLKPQMWKWTPFDRTVFMDSDTLVVANIDEMFTAVDRAPYFVTSFSNWRSNGRKISRRVEGMRGRSPMVDHLLDCQKRTPTVALNTGVLGWNADADGMYWWEFIVEAISLGTGNRPPWIADELAMQILFENTDYCLLGRRFNCSPLFDEDEKEPIVWHFHGRKHMRDERGKKIWYPAFCECEAENPAHIKAWARNYDKEITEYE